MFSGSAMMLAVFNYFVRPLSEGLALSLTETSAAISIYLAILIVSTPAAGIVADRIGSRATLMLSGLVYAAGLLWIARAASATELYLAFAATAVAGGGASTIGYARAIIRTFDRHRGLALGVAMSGGGLVAMILPMVVRAMVLEHGWRAGFVVLAVMAAAVHLAAGWMSGRGERRQDADRMTAPEEGKSFAEAVATPTFWIMGAAFTLFGLAVAGLVSHLSEIWQALGLDTAGVPAFQFGLGMAALFGRIAGGWAMDHVPANFVAAASALAGAFGVLLLAMGDGQPVLLVASIAIGFCTGTESDALSFLSGRYFGLRHFGRIYGAFASSFLAGAACGPISYALLARSFDVRALLALEALALTVSALLLASLSLQRRAAVPVVV
jgi:MFS family permease